MQRSGVGDPSLLGPLGIDTVLNIPTVGKNLQEQTQTAMGAGSNGFNSGGNGPSDVIAYPNLYQLFGDQGNSMASTIQTSINTWAASQASNALSQAALQTIYQVHADLIVNKNGTDHSAPDLLDNRFLTTVLQLLLSNSSTTPDIPMLLALTSGPSCLSAVAMFRSVLPTPS